MTMTRRRRSGRARRRSRHGSKRCTHTVARAYRVDTGADSTHTQKWTRAVPLGSSTRARPLTGLVSGVAVQPPVLAPLGALYWSRARTASLADSMLCTWVPSGPH
jgi:hypothetical protein